MLAKGAQPAAGSHRPTVREPWAVFYCAKGQLGPTLPSTHHRTRALLSGV